MNNEIIKLIEADFSEKDREKAIKEMSSITLKHVMAESEQNLKNTWLAILKLSKGNLTELIRLVECAKQDFRDVIYWSTME